MTLSRLLADILDRREKEREGTKLRRKRETVEFAGSGVVEVDPSKSGKYLGEGEEVGRRRKNSRIGAVSNCPNLVRKINSVSVSSASKYELREMIVVPERATRGAQHLAERIRNFVSKFIRVEKER